jgi:4-carboxymuconolactone decarboxylase
MPNETYERGLAIRKEVVGADYVERSLSRADEFTAPLQDLITEYCWGAVWGRDGLSRGTRSLLNVAMLTALNRPHELKLHVTGALRNGCSTDDIREVLLQAAIYCGVPAALDSFRAAKDAIAAYEAGPGQLA